MGHTAEEMVSWVNAALEDGRGVRCRDFIVSGGVRDALSGLSLVRSCRGRSVFAMAHGLLGAARAGPGPLRARVLGLLSELAMAEAFLDHAGEAP